MENSHNESDKNTMGIDIGLKNLAICALDMSSGDIKLWRKYSVIPEPETCKVCERPGTFINAEEHFCGIHSKGVKKTREKVKKILVKNLSNQEIATLVITKIKEIIGENTETFGNVCSVVIEMQPRFNPKMCFVSHLVFCLLCDFYLSIGSEAVVKFEHAGIKLKKYKKSKAKISYKMRKRLAIDTVRELVIGSDYMEFFNNCKKADDIADALLLANNQRL